MSFVNRTTILILAAFFLFLYFPKMSVLAGPGNSVLIDSKWLTRHRAPYVLDEPNTTYTLLADVRESGSAFMVSASGVTLDLNQHTILFDDNPPPPEVPNGDFRECTRGWDTHRADSAKCKPALIGMTGPNALELSGSGIQTVVSSATSLPEANRPYVAVITAKGSWDTQVVLTVHDAVTGQVLGTGKCANPERGFSAVAHFTPPTAHPVTLEVDVTPAHGNAVTFLDSAAVMFSGNTGVAGFGTKCANLTVKNGRVIQGEAESFGSSALRFLAIPNLTVENIETTTRGMDPHNINAIDCSRIMIHHCACHYRGKSGRISNRMELFAAISATGYQGTVSIKNNTITGFPQAGILLTGRSNQEGGEVANNNIRQNSKVTNGYGITLSAVQNVRIVNNRITTVDPGENGQGIILDDWNGPSLHVEMAYNRVETSEKYNLEYPDTDWFDAKALRVRDESRNAHRDLYIHDNFFLVKTGPGHVRKAAAGKITCKNAFGQNNGANNRYERNVFEALLTTGDRNYGATALDIDAMDPKTDTRIAQNTLRSHDVGLLVSSLKNWRQGIDGFSFVDNRIERLPYGPVRPFIDIKR